MSTDINASATAYWSSAHAADPTIDHDQEYLPAGSSGNSFPLGRIESDKATYSSDAAARASQHAEDIFLDTSLDHPEHDTTAAQTDEKPEKPGHRWSDWQQQ